MGHYHDRLQCHTDLVTCCNRSQGADRGDWYFPSEDRLQFYADPGDIYEQRIAQRVDIRRRNNGDTSGIYRCAIETNAVRSDNITDITTRVTVYVGLYSSGGRCDYCFMLTLIVKMCVGVINVTRTPERARLHAFRRYSGEKRRENDAKVTRNTTEIPRN